MFGKVVLGVLFVITLLILVFRYLANQESKTNK